MWENKQKNFQFLKFFLHFFSSFRFLLLFDGTFRMQCSINGQFLDISARVPLQMLYARSITDKTIYVHFNHVRFHMGIFEYVIC